MNTTSMQNPPKMLDQGSKDENTCRYGCYIFFCWIFQLSCWGLLIGGIFSTTLFILFAIIYIIYIILEFCSKTSRYLCNKSTSQGMYDKMGHYFRTPPIIRFYGECYHYETRYHTRTDSQGNIEHYTTKEKVVTYTESYDLPYYSERDVSGLFYLNCEEAYVSKKHYIKLELLEEINFADAISYSDYEREKSHFWNRNRFRDVYFYFSENRFIPGMEHLNLVKLVEKEPCMANYFFFFISTILTIAEIYRIYFNSLCVYQKFKVRKIVSTRYDLNQQVYQELAPQINLIVIQYKYEQKDYNYLNQDYEPQLPTKEEIEAAQKYQNKVPDYKISSGEGVIKAGVIIDEPRYSIYNQNEPPAELPIAGGNLTLAQNQNNINKGLPEGDNQPGFKSNISSQVNIVQNPDATNRQIEHIEN